MYKSLKKKKIVRRASGQKQTKNKLYQHLVYYVFLVQEEAEDFNCFRCSAEVLSQQQFEADLSVKVSEKPALLHFRQAATGGGNK